MDAPISRRTAVPASTSAVAAATYEGPTSSPRHAPNSALKVDPARVTVPPLDAPQLQDLRAALGAAMAAVDAELTWGGPGGPVAAAPLADVMAVYLLRHAPSHQPRARGARNELPRTKLRAVLGYVEEHLDASPTLEQMAAVARLSPTYFASQFKRTTGLPPHRYIIGRRIERAKQALQSGLDLSLAQVALQAGFTDQSQFSHHFKRFIGVTPGEFRRRTIERPGPCGVLGRYEPRAPRLLGTPADTRQVVLMLEQLPGRQNVGPLIFTIYLHQPTGSSQAATVRMVIGEISRFPDLRMLPAAPLVYS
jgi:AraC-like DNA-binding protein